MNESNRNVIGKIYQCFNNRDLEAILPFLDPHVIWSHGWDDSLIEGPAAVKAYWEFQWKEINPNVKPLSIKVNSSDAIEAMVHQVVKDLQGNIISDNIVKHVYTFENALIKHMGDGANELVVELE